MSKRRMSTPINKTVVFFYHLRQLSMFGSLRDSAEGFACLRPKRAYFSSIEEVATFTTKKDGNKHPETYLSPLILTLRCTVQRPRKALGGRILKYLGYHKKKTNVSDRSNEMTDELTRDPSQLCYTTRDWSVLMLIASSFRIPA